jgi:hypothetical protein
VRDFHFGKAAWRGCIDGGHDSFDVAAQGGPLLVANNQKRHLPGFQVLLVTQVFVSRQQKLETCGLSSLYQFAVSKPVLSAFNGFNNDMALEGMPKGGRDTVIEEYEHPPRGRGPGQKARQGCGPRIRSPL